MSDFIHRRLKQLKPVGAVLGTGMWTIKENVWVSTVRIADQVWTRVENHDRTEMFHFEGDLTLDNAAYAYRQAKEGVFV